MFIHDLERYFIEDISRRVSIDYTKEILALGYADDFVFQCDSSLEASKRLSSLHDYCKTNRLIVNTLRVLCYGVQIGVSLT